MHPDILAFRRHVRALPVELRPVALEIHAACAGTLACLAFARACDVCAEAGRDYRHPDDPGAGGDYSDTMPRSGAAYIRTIREARAAAARVYRSTAEAWGCDPATAVQAWADAGNVAAGRRRPSAAEAWGSDAAMSATGTGVRWTDDNEPICHPATGAELPDPGYRTGGEEEGPDWRDRYTARAERTLRTSGRW